MQNGDILLVVGSALIAFGIIAVLSGSVERVFSRKGGLSILIGAVMIGLATLRKGHFPDFETWSLATIRIISAFTGPL